VEAVATLPVRGVTSILSSTLLAAISKLIVAGVTSRTPAVSLLAAHGARSRAAGAISQALSSVSG
jgi:hypothetical protein